MYVFQLYSETTLLLRPILSDRLEVLLSGFYHIVINRNNLLVVSKHEKKETGKNQFTFPVLKQITCWLWNTFCCQFIQTSMLLDTDILRIWLKRIYPYIETAI